MSIPDPVHKPVLGFVEAQLVVNSVICFLVIATVALRVIGRRTGPGCGLDDWLVIAATPLGVVMLVCQGLFAVVGNGYDLNAHPELATNVEYILVVTFAMQIFYVLLLALVKASMLCFYLRIFVTPRMQMLSKAGLGVVVAWAVAYLAACVFLCDPIAGQWTGVGKCGTYMALIQSLIVTNAIGDALIMVMPMHSIWTLQMRRTDKVGVISCFLVGLACIVCAIFRVIYLSSVALSTNVTGTMPTTVFLFVLEPNLAILCVSIPMLRPVFRRYRKRLGGSRLHGEDGVGLRATGASSSRSSSAPQKYLGAAAGSSSSSSAVAAAAAAATTTTTITKGGPGGRNVLAVSQWELEEYESGHESVSSSSSSSSCGAVGAPRGEAREGRMSGHATPRIGVETTWTVTRE